jgi:hypothetical protein
MCQYRIVIQRLLVYGLGGIFIMDTTFTKAYNDDLHSADLTPIEKLTYMILCSFDYDDDCEVKPSQETLSNLIGRSERQIRRVLKNLHEKGYIVINTIKNYAYHKSRNTYFLVKKYTNRAAEAFKKLSTDTGQKSPMVIGHGCPPDYITGDKLIDDSTAQEVIKSFNEPDDIISEVLDKVKGKTIRKKSLSKYLLKVIATIKAERNCTYRKNNYKPNKYNTNNYHQRNYDTEFEGGWDELERKLRGASDKRLL